MTNISIRRRLLQALAASLVVSACGGGGGDGAGNGGMPPPVVGAAGGFVASPEGASVTIPAGALAAEVPIAVAKVTNGAPVLPPIPDVQAAGDVFALTPHGTTFAVPVTLSVPFDPARVPVGATLMLIKADAQGVWAPVAGAAASGAEMTGLIRSFSFPVPVFVFAPTISQPPVDQTVAAGQSATFSVVATGHFGPAPLVYQWYSSADHGVTWTVIAGATSASYTSPPTLAADDGKRIRVNVGLQAAPWVNVDSASATLSVASTATALPMVAAGVHHTLALKSDGTVWAWGRNDLAQLGNGSNSNSSIPVQPLGLPPISKVAVGHYHSLALAADGSVWQWGNTLNIPSVPTRVAMAGRFVDIAEGDFFSLAVRDDGTVWSWDGSAAALPGPVSGATGVVAVSAGARQALGLKSDGTVLSWSSPGGSAVPVPDELGTGTLTRVVSIRAMGDWYFAFTFDGFLNHLYFWGSGFALPLGGQVLTYGSQKPQLAPSQYPFETLPLDSYAIAQGTTGAFVLTIDAANGNAVKGLGANGNGQLGIGTTVDATTAAPLPGLLDVRQVDATRVFLATYAVARKADGTVWAWGDNSTGQLGDGTTTNRLVPVQVQGLDLN